MRKITNVLLCTLLVFTIVLGVAGCKKSTSPDSTETFVPVTEASTTVENTEDTTECETETESLSETEPVETDALSDERDRYWSSDFAFNLLPKFTEADFTGFLSSGDKQSVAFENVTYDMAMEYIEKVKSESFILDASVRDMDNYVSFDSHDEQNVYYFIYYDKQGQTLDITADTSAQGQIVY